MIRVVDMFVAATAFFTGGFAGLRAVKESDRGWFITCAAVMAAALLSFLWILGAL